MDEVPSASLGSSPGPSSPPLVSPAGDSVFMDKVPSAPREPSPGPSSLSLLSAAGASVLMDEVQSAPLEPFKPSWSSPAPPSNISTGGSVDIQEVPPTPVEPPVYVTVSSSSSKSALNIPIKDAASSPSAPGSQQDSSSDYPEVIYV